jgi:hypothetical protein
MGLFSKKPKKIIVDKLALLGRQTDDHVSKGTPSLPSILFKKDGNCIISGNSRPDSIDGIYNDAKYYLSELITEGIKINFTFDFDFFNTTTQRYIYTLLQELDKQKEPGKVIWKHFDDEDSHDLAEMFSLMFPRLKIDLIKK